MVIELNKFGVNLEKEKKRPNVIYISSALISAICGVLTALTTVLFNDSIILWVIMDILGTFLGTKSLKIITKIICINLSFLKNSNVLDDTMKSLSNIGEEPVEEEKTKRRRVKEKTNDKT